MGDNDARCGPSSIQRFDGEDLAAAERSQAQHQQCYDWWEAQHAQHEAQKAAQLEATLQEQEAVSFCGLLNACPSLLTCRKNSAHSMQLKQLLILSLLCSGSAPVSLSCWLRYLVTNGFRPQQANFELKKSKLSHLSVCLSPCSSVCLQLPVCDSVHASVPRDEFAQKSLLSWQVSAPKG